MKITFGPLMLCQGCGYVLPFDAEGHNEEYACDCGGQWCGCAGCNDVITRYSVKFSGAGQSGVPGATACARK